MSKMRRERGGGELNVLNAARNASSPQFPAFLESLRI